MKKLSLKNIVEFKRIKSDNSKRNFVASLKVEKQNFAIESGGDYWISCLSAISNSYKWNDIQHVLDKRLELEEKCRQSNYKRTKTMYKRNIDILRNYEDFDLDKWFPSKKINFLKKQKSDSILRIKGLQVQVNPSHVFSFKKNRSEEIGAIWFVAKLGGFSKDELEMFADVLHRYLKEHFSKDYVLNPEYCIAVDVFNNIELKYSQLEKEETLSILNLTIDEIKNLL